MTDVPDRRVLGADNVPVADLLPEGYAELLARGEGRRAGQPDCGRCGAANTELC